MWLRRAPYACTNAPSTCQLAAPPDILLLQVGGLAECPVVKVSQGQALLAGAVAGIAQVQQVQGAHQQAAIHLVVLQQGMGDCEVKTQICASPGGSRASHRAAAGSPTSS